MQFLRLSFIYFIKLCLKIVPEVLIKHLKSSPALTAMYSSTINKSGYLHRFPKKQDVDSFYKNYQQIQNKLIDEIVSTSANDSACFTTLLILVPKFDPALYKGTMESIKRLNKGFDAILFLCNKNDVVYCENACKEEDKLDLNIIVIDVVFSNELSDKLINSECFVIYLGDSLNKDILTVLTSQINQGVDIVYTDSDRKLKNDIGAFPHFKPDWNPDLQITTGYVDSGIWIKSLSQIIFNANFSLSATTIIEFLVLEYLADTIGQVQHVPLVLTSRPFQEKIDMRCLSKNSKKTLSNIGVLSFSSEYNTTISLEWSVASQPLVSLIIPTKNALSLVQTCIESILNKTIYTNYEILLVDNNSDDAGALEYFDTLRQHPKIRVLKYPYPFNYSAINNFAVKHAKGSIIGLVNNDIEVITPRWLNYMVGHALRSDIGCVGAKLLYPNETIQHAGVVMGYGGGAGHAHKYFPKDHPGYLNRIQATNNFSAVTAACLLVKKDHYKQVGGLNEQNLTVAFNDVDFCLKVLELGIRNIYCAEAVLYHHESVSRGVEDTIEKQKRFAKELAYIKTHWSDYIELDPAYNSNLTLKKENFSIRD